MSAPEHLPPDPFTLVYRRLWQTLEEHAGFASLVRLGNRVRIGEGPAPGAALPADRPQVELRPTAARVRLFDTSTSSVVEQDFSLLLRCGERRPEAELFPLRWQVLRALASAGDALALPFVEKVRVRDDRLTLPDPASRTGESGGWQALITLTVQMRFDQQTHLSAQESPTWS
jgi:hypothetical protein